MKTSSLQLNGNTPNPCASVAPSTVKFERLGECLYRKGGTIYARLRVNGKLTWRSTGTSEPREARQWLRKWKNDGWLLKNGIEPKGVVLQRQRVTVQEVVDAYVKAGCPTRKMRSKSPCTIRKEKYFLNPMLAYFGQMPAASLSLADCDKFLDWRTSGGYVAKFTVRGKPQTMQTRGGKRAVDLELVVLGNALSLAVRRGVLSSNPLSGRSRYTCTSETRHCREVAPSPEGLARIESWLRGRNEHGVADVVCFLAYSGLRIGEALSMEWEMVDWPEKLLHVKREKKGITPWVPILNEMEALLRDMQKRATSYLLFPSPFESERAADASAIRRRINAACAALGLGHVTPHGLRSYFVTRARESGLSDAEIAMLIGDKTGPSIIAHTYGDVRPDHLLKQAQRIRLTATQPSGTVGQVSSIKSSNTSPDVTTCFTSSQQNTHNAETAEITGD
ncbi:MAG TPA: tyrosine-type recombinase/integrase [Candidatus Eisenbacteria bacterium]|nr:tyrosine-type recombinase/integrase [Candidatus Eisenbacteria bacterium]